MYAELAESERQMRIKMIESDRAKEEAVRQAEVGFGFFRGCLWYV